MTNNLATDAVIGGRSGRFYAAIWRWHFYAGLFVAPFFLIAALSGLAMTLKTPIEALAYGDRFYVAPQGQTLSPQEQMVSVVRSYPYTDILTYIPPGAANRSAQFVIAAHGGGEHGAGHFGGDGYTVFVNPYTGDVLGGLDPASTLYSYAKTLHGTLFLGAFGDHLIEIAAGFGILMILTGLFLWAPRAGQSFAEAIAPRIKKMNRSGWRSLHAATGFWVSIVLLFFLVSGLAWTPVWGGKLTQAWGSFPAERFAAPVSEKTHETLNHGSQKTIPWALEQTPLPISNPAKTGDEAPDLNDVVAMAHDKGFTGFRVHFPKDEAGAWTVAAATISGDIADPHRDRTLHVDRHTGAILADVGFEDYSLMGKAMAAGVPLHQGDLGPWNIVLNIVFCLAVIAMIVSGIAMWWLRRPKKRLRLAPPPSNRRAWRYGALCMLGVSALFPMTAATLAVVIAADFLVFSRVSRLAMLLK